MGQKAVLTLKRKASLAMRMGGGGENGMDEEEDKDAEEVEEGVNPPIVPPIISGKNLLHSFDSAGDNNDEEGINFSFLLNDDEERRGPFDAATMPSSQARRGSEKRKTGDGANPKRSHAFSQPLKTPRKSMLGNSEDNIDNDGFLFGKMMSYMMYQNRVVSE